jgi:TonB family protein
MMLVLAAVHLCAQTAADSGEPVRVGLGITPPRLIRKIEPEYSSEARTDRIQGTVILQLIVNEQGRPVDISVISPLGFGLDEQAQAAVGKWEFRPGMKAGVPVKILASVEVNFRFPGIRFDERAERQRTAFNIAIQGSSRANAGAAEVERAVKSMTDLAKQKFPPALYIAGSWKINGEHGPKDPAAGLELIRQAAEKNHAAALYEVGLRRNEGRDLALDFDKGMEEMRSASVLGSRQAQFYLGRRYESGNGVALDPERAKRQYRLCAAQGVAQCQYRLGRFLYDAPERKERDYLQSLALFQLAAEQGVTEAAQVVSGEAGKLTGEQSAWVAELKRQIVRK